MKIGESTTELHKRFEIHQSTQRVNPHQDQTSQKNSTGEAGSFRETLNRVDQGSARVSNEDRTRSHLRAVDDYNRVMGGESQRPESATVEIRLEDPTTQNRGTEFTAQQRPTWEGMRANETIAEGQFTSETQRTAYNQPTQQASEMRQENMGHDLGQKQTVNMHAMQARIPESQAAHPLRFMSQTFFVRA